MLWNGIWGGAMVSAGENKHDVDFNDRPFIAIWEATQACDLACVHCRASAQPLRSSFELSTAEAERVIDQIAEMRVPVFVITGGDPLKRPDLFDLVGYATERGVRTSLTPSAARGSTSKLPRRSTIAAMFCKRGRRNPDASGRRLRPRSEQGMKWLAKMPPTALAGRRAD